MPPNLDPGQYRSWRQTALGQVTESLEQDLVFRLAGDVTGLRVLDVGCGDGTYALGAAKRGALALGLDLSADMLQAAACRGEEVGLRIPWVRGDAKALPFADQSFQIVLAVTLLCFLRNPERALLEMSRVLTPGGTLILGDLGRWSLWAGWRRIKGRLGSKTWLGVPFRSASDLRSMVEAAGLLVLETRGAVHYPPIGWIARAARVLDPALERSTVGAAFIAIRAQAP